MNSFTEIIRRYSESFFSLFYPRTCAVCGNLLPGLEKVLCVECMNTLPETGFHRHRYNPVEEIFTGRLKIEQAMALLFFDKGSKYRRLIHLLKYHSRTDIGLFLGRMMGSRLLTTEFGSTDILVPVPLHGTKMKKRGFNQSQVIAMGISEIMGKPVDDKILLRKIANPTQTRKGRYERWQNVEGIFDINQVEKAENKHILLVDDVVTTGSTIEAAGSCLLKVPGLKLSVAAVAYAN